MSTSDELATGIVAIDSLTLRRTCGAFGTGVTVITTRVDGADHGMTANAFLSVSLDPPLILVSIARSAKMLGRIEAVGRYAVSVLSAEMADIAWHFAGKPRDWLTAPFTNFAGLPVIRGALAHVVARSERTIQAGDHVLFLGAVEHLHRDEGAPLLFHDGRFCGTTAIGDLAAALPPWTSGPARVAARYVEEAPELW